MYKYFYYYYYYYYYYYVRQRRQRPRTATSIHCSTLLMFHDSASPTAARHRPVSGDAWRHTKTVRDVVRRQTSQNTFYCRWRRGQDVFAGVDLSLRSTAARFFSDNKKRSFALGCKAVPITLFIARAISRVTYQVLYLSSDTGGIIPKVHQINNFNHQYGMAAVNMSTNKERK